MRELPCSVSMTAAGRTLPIPRLATRRIGWRLLLAGAAPATATATTRWEAPKPLRVPIRSSGRPREEPSADSSDESSDESRGGPRLCARRTCAVHTGAAYSPPMCMCMYARLKRPDPFP